MADALLALHGRRADEFADEIGLLRLGKARLNGAEKLVDAWVLGQQIFGDVPDRAEAAIPQGKATV